MQLRFPFVKRAEELMHLADAGKLVRKNEKYGPTLVHRIRRWNLWLVSAHVPIRGPSGYAGASVTLYYGPYFTGRDAWRVARHVTWDCNKPFLEQAWEDLYAKMFR